MSEDGGPVEILVGVLEGNLAIPVEVSFATADGTAFGKLLRVLLLVYESLVYTSCNGISIICANKKHNNKILL